MEIKKKKRTQMCFDISEEEHRFIKANAAIRGISINLWMHTVLRKEIERLKQYE